MKLLTLTLLATTTLSCTTTVAPKEVDEFYKTSVMITNTEESSGGTGVIYRSGPDSYVLTNRHVCQLLEEGGYVLNDNKYKVRAYKPSKVHDLCLVWVRSNLGVNTVLAPEPPPLRSKAFISGHPSLYPHVVSNGYVSDHMKIEVVMDFRPCTDKEVEQDPIMCIFYGYPIVEELQAQLVSALIAPGSSGSAVFNEQGQLIGLAFASNSRNLAYALVVPWENLTAFVTSEADTLKWIYPKAKTRKKATKDLQRANTLPFDIKEESNFYDITNWKKLLETVQKESQCKK